MSKVRMGTAAAVLAAGMIMGATVPSEAAARELGAYQPKAQNGKVWASGIYKGYKKVCVQLLQESFGTLPPVVAASKCQNVAPSSIGSTSVGIKCPREGIFRTLMSGTRTNNRKDIKDSAPRFVKCR
ncbi:MULTISPECIES: hypothetical protein [Streptomyces]|uniref:Uncharacterized protein n=2 Tax=Streptomyces TaxID=1883 RepID=A0A0W7WR30_9ACTN|nr:MULTISPECIES: hypothetical protein [Streptomyces]KUF13059.1 hypothetical protein AT728_37625 [Streptomyces silvensis]MVO83454.1 hypothetical protein [Streptomyces typhae]